MLGRNPQPRRRVQEGIGRGLAARVVAMGDDRVEASGEAMGGEVPADVGMVRGGGDRPRQPQRVEGVEQPQDAGLQRQAAVDDGVELPDPVGLEGVDREARAEMVEEGGAVDPGRPTRLRNSTSGRSSPREAATVIAASR